MDWIIWGVKFRSSGETSSLCRDHDFTIGEGCRPTLSSLPEPAFYGDIFWSPYRKAALKITGILLGADSGEALVRVLAVATTSGVTVEKVRDVDVVGLLAVKYKRKHQCVMIHWYCNVHIQNHCWNSTQGGSGQFYWHRTSRYSVT